MFRACLSMLLLALSARALTPQEEIDAQVPAARRILDAWHANQPQPGRRELHLVLWTPADREPAPRFRERLSAILLDIQSFYAREMQRHGFGPRTIGLPKQADGLLRIHLVRGLHPYDEYNVDSGHAIREECRPVLAKAGIDVQNETVVIFCNMSVWDAAARTMSQNSPYYASGTHRSGTAWQVDSPLLDLELLVARDPPLEDGQYGRISPGRYNSIFIGGIAHELGHALGLPHNGERKDQRAAFGTALMGSGNRTYGEDRRGEGKGSFLTLAHALRLAAHPMFSGSVKGMQIQVSAGVENLRVEESGSGFRVTGRVVADPPVYAVVGYMDPRGGDDYDATSCSAIPDASGRFALEAQALRRGGKSEFRIVLCHVNGAATRAEQVSFPYQVDDQGKVDVTTARARLELTPLAAEVAAGKWPEAARELARLASGRRPRLLLETASELVASQRAPSRPAPSAATGSVCRLSQSRPVEAKTGYGPAVYDRLPYGSPLLVAGGELFPRGIYAHAISRHVYDLGGKWKTLAGKAGLADGKNGTVIFRITDGARELWKSPLCREGDLHDFSVPVEGVQTLILEVDAAQDGNRADWGVWADPTLTR